MGFVCMRVRSRLGCPPLLAPSCIRVFAEWVVCERTLLLASTDDPTILMILCEVVVTLET